MVWGKKVVVGNIKPRRDFTFVSDTVRGFILLACQKGVEGETFNLGTQRDVAIRQLIAMISKILGTNAEIEVDGKRVRGNQSEVLRLLSNNCKAVKILGWQPAYTLEEGLRITIEWMKERGEFGKPSIYNM
jgi:dTDP-glucose 4,6-dehydratase